MSLQYCLLQSENETILANLSPIIYKLCFVFDISIVIFNANFIIQVECFDNTV